MITVLQVVSGIEGDQSFTAVGVYRTNSCFFLVNSCIIWKIPNWHQRGEEILIYSQTLKNLFSPKQKKPQAKHKNPKNKQTKSVG